jgi:hypothetical protein
MRKFNARAARLARFVVQVLIPVLTAIKLLVEIVSKAVNCRDYKLPIQIQDTRQVHLCS